MTVHGQKYEVAYWPGDSKSGMFGGNSNWCASPFVDKEAILSFVEAWPYLACDKFFAH